MINIWTIFGIVLIIWVLYDVYRGVTWIHKPVYRKYEPELYWVVILVWAGLAFITLYSGLIV